MSVLQYRKVKMVTYDKLRVNQVLYEAFRIICCIKPFKYKAMFVSWDTKL